MKGESVKFQRGEEIIHTFPNYLSKSECRRYASTIPDLGVGVFDWPLRTRDITNDPIVERLQKFLNKTFDLNLKIAQAQTQNWNQTSFSDLHIHTYRPDATYNSSIYLNHNFEGGTFFTRNGIKIKPEVGLLTFFDGRKVWHGVEEVKGKDRKSLIFWWTGE